MGKSHSLRVSGLKSAQFFVLTIQSDVSLFTSEWIEITYNPEIKSFFCVSLYMSEWIEIINSNLKNAKIKVSLYMSEWIEICHSLMLT